MKAPIIYALSDSLGETAERVARAAASQYDQENFDIIRRTGEIPAPDLETAWKMAQSQLAEANKKDYTITVMGHASATFPVMK